MTCPNSHYHGSQHYRVLYLFSFGSKIRQKEVISENLSSKNRNNKLKLREGGEEAQILALPLTTWANYLTRPCPSAFIYKMERTVVAIFLRLLHIVANSHNLLIFLFLAKIGKIIDCTLSLEDFSLKKRNLITESQVVIV